ARARATQEELQMQAAFADDERLRDTARLAARTALATCLGLLPERTVRVPPVPAYTARAVSLRREADPVAD
ncbi:MAG: hypothetical protein WBA67_04245, partial [Jannaschia sp.]